MLLLLLLLSLLWLWWLLSFSVMLVGVVAFSTSLLLLTILVNAVVVGMITGVVGEAPDSATELKSLLAPLSLRSLSLLTVTVLPDSVAGRPVGGVVESGDDEEDVATASATRFGFVWSSWGTFTLLLEEPATTGESSVPGDETPPPF